MFIHFLIYLNYLEESLGSISFARNDGKQHKWRMEGEKNE